MKTQPYTVAQVLANLPLLEAELSSHRTSVNGGPGWVRLILQSMICRGIESPKNRPIASSPALQNMIARLKLTRAEMDLLGINHAQELTENKRKP
jgi:hypothetical protein